MAEAVIFGGTFNPIHNGHIEIINELLLLDGVKRVVVIPTRIPPHKAAPDLASGADRLAMCRLATKQFSCVEVSDIEFMREGPSYTYDTVTEFMRKSGERVAVACGADMVTTLSEWYKYRELIKLADIIAFRRKGTDNALFDRAVCDITRDGGNVTVIEKELTDISSSRIRNEKSTLLPVSVFEYIKEKRLYGYDG